MAKERLAAGLGQSVERFAHFVLVHAELLRYALDLFVFVETAEQEMDRHLKANYLSPVEASQVLKISPARVRSFIRSGALKASNLSNTSRPRLLIRKEDLDAFVKSRAVQAQAPVARRKPKVDASFKRYRA